MVTLKSSQNDYKKEFKIFLKNVLTMVTTHDKVLSVGGMPPLVLVSVPSDSDDWMIYALIWARMNKISLI